MNSLAKLETSDLKQLADQLEDQLGDVASELEYRLTHIQVGGHTIRLRFDHIGPQVLCWRADGEQPNRIGQGSDCWAAREDLLEMLQSWGCDEPCDSAELDRVDSMDAEDFRS
jgi:hypothetical protein